MFDSAVLNVPIGLAVVFAVFSVAVSRINEFVLTLLRLRARSLETEIRRLLDGPGAGQPPTEAVTAGTDPAAGTDTSLTAKLFDGPLRALRTGGRDVPPPNMAGNPPPADGRGAHRRARALRLPAYIPSRAFASGVLAVLNPPARAMLRRIDPATLSGEALSAYQAAEASLTRDTAHALVAAIPTADAATRTLAEAVAGMATTDPVGTLAAEIAKLPDGSAIQTALLSIIARVGTDLDKIAQGLAQWYDGAMDRLSGVYKRRVQKFILVWAAVVVLGFNLDAVSVTRTLWSDSSVRSVVVSTAEAQVDAGTAGTGSPATGSSGSRAPASVGDVTAAADRAARAVRDTSALDLPIGWGGNGPRKLPSSADDWLLKILGWVISTLALLMGAPFWFDLLGRLVNMRDSGPKPAPAQPAQPALPAQEVA
jgi:hypothetical protein